MIDQIDHAVEERNIMRNENKRIFIIIEIPLQPLNMLHIQIVGRLVQKKDIRLFQKKLSKQHLRSLTAAQLRHITVQADVCKAQRPSHFLYFCINHIEIMGGQKFLDHTRFFHIRSHFFVGCIRHLVIHLVHLLFQLKQEAKSGRQRLPDSHAFFQLCVLIQITDAHIFRPFYFSFIWLQFSGNNAHECRFSLSVGSHETYMLAFEQTERYILKNGAVAKSVA